jgi:dCMP deaminase
MQTYDSKDPFWQEYGNKEIKDLYTCPRRLLGYASGQGLHLCPAAHAERNCISNAAMHGVYTKGSTCYLNAEAPCKDCMASLINAGIKHIVCLRKEAYDPISNILAKEAQVLIREV